MADFERKLTDLEAVVERLEEGDLSSKSPVRLFEEGMKLSEAASRNVGGRGRQNPGTDGAGGGKLKARSCG